MKKLLFAIVMLAGVGGVRAQREGASKEVAAAVESLRKALIDPTKENLDAIAMDELTYGHSNGVIQDKAAFEDALLTKKSDFVTIDLTDQTIKVVGSTAWVRHTLSATSNDGGKPGTVHLYVLTVWTKVKGKWRLLARQAVKAPV
ncbi:MAG: nuclear transport factor 2 family protein [Bacteroidetes bacterium]|nr:nuclear transport factor 2 family protein [Bacteroidota bacterium]